MGAHRGCLGRKRGSPRSSQAVAQGGGATDAAGRRGVVAVVTWAPSAFYRAEERGEAEKFKVRWGMDAMIDYEIPSAFYRAEERGEAVPWRRNGRQWMKFFNAPISERKEEGASPVLEGERSTRGGSCFPHGGAIVGYSGLWRWPATGVRRRLDCPEVEDNQSGQLH
jgi:hypothetical protein